MSRRFPFTLVVFLVLSMSIATFGQSTITAGSWDGRTPPALTPGAPAGSYPLSGFENVNLFNGKASVAIPLMEIGARGEARYTMMVTVDRTWDVSTIDNCELDLNGNKVCHEATIVDDASTTHSFAPGLSPGTMWSRASGDNVTYCVASGNPGGLFYHADNTVTRLTFTAASGTETEFVDTATYGRPASHPSGTCSPSLYVPNSRGRTFIATDGSGTRFTADTDILDYGPGRNIGTPISGTLRFPNGTAYTILNGQVTRIRDRNGNILTLQYDGQRRLQRTIDSIGREISIGYQSNLTTITEQATGRTITLRKDAITNLFRSGYSAQTGEQLFPNLIPPVTVRSLDPIAGGYALAFIEYPNGRIMRFRYNSYGEIARIELPTGGAYEYDWANFQGGTIQLPQEYYTGISTFMVYRRVVERRVYNSGNALEQVQVFGTPLVDCNPPASGYPKQCTTTVSVYFTDATRTNNAGIETHKYFGDPAYVYAGPQGVQGVPTTVGWMKFYSPWKWGREYMTQIGTSTAAPFSRVIQTQWEQPQCAVTGNACWFSDANADTAPHHWARTFQTILTEGTVVSSQVTCYDRYNNRADVYDYDFGSAPGALSNCQSAPPNFTRWTRFDYKGAAAYTDPDVNLIHLQTLELIHGPMGLIAKTGFSYDDYAEPGLALLSYPSNPIQHDSAFDANYGLRGNITKVYRWLDAAGNRLTSTKAYDVIGNVVVETDARNNPTRYVFNSSCNYAYPTTIINALNQSTLLEYDCNLGKVTLSTDPNQVRTRLTYETGTSGLGRIMQVDRAFQRSEQATTRFAYDDSPGNMSVTTTTTITAQAPANQCAPNPPLVSGTIYDGLGRETASTMNTAAGRIKTTTSYDARGRTAVVSSPFAVDANNMPTETARFTLTVYDELHRAKRITAPDGSITSNTYLNNTVTTSDPLGKSKRITTDALGRIVSVVEDPQGVAVLTSYAYDAQGKLTMVCQNGAIAGTSCSGQARTFTYDMPGRLTSAFNPESGTTLFSLYDENDNLKRKSDPRSVSIDYAYDALNRLETKTYSDGTPKVRFTYDTGYIGRPASISTVDNGNVVLTSTTLGYDALGRTINTASNVLGFIARMSYDYDSADRLIAITYPSQQKVNNCFDVAGRPAKVVDAAPPNTAYASGPLPQGLVQYESFGGIKNIVFGNGVVESANYNSRLQPTSISVTKNGNTLLNLLYGYSKTIGCNLGTFSCNNGNVYGQWISDGNWSASQTYDYDALNRLQWAQETGSGSGWRQHYGYDAFGNGWVVDPAANPTLTYGIALSPRTPIGSTTASSWFLSNNRLNLANSFDAVGNQIQYLPWSLTYDAENRQTSAQQVVNGTTIRHTYDYDGEGRRVRHQLQTSTGNGPWTVSATTTFVYDALGRLAAEYGSTPTTLCTTCYITTDPLGSTRLITDENGSPKSRSDFLPFGEEIPADRTNRSTIPCGTSSCFGQATGITQKFTSKERDVETGLDNFLARYYSSAQGRFTSPDLPLLDQDAADPQSWNLYSYVRNNPLKYIDPTGRDCIYTNQIDSNGAVGVEAGNCSSKSGVFVNGSINSLTWDSRKRTLGYTFTPSDGGIGTGIVRVSPQPSDRLDTKGRAFVTNMAARVDASNEMLAKLIGVSVVAGVGAGTYPVVAEWANEVAFGPAVGRLFFEGKLGYEAAAAFGGGRLISGSPLGQQYAKWVESGLQNWPGVSRLGWQVLSRFWASGAAGTTNIFLSGSNPRSLLWTTELPVLLRNPNVFRIWH